MIAGEDAGGDPNFQQHESQVKLPAYYLLVKGLQSLDLCSPKTLRRGSTPAAILNSEESAVSFS